MKHPLSVFLEFCNTSSNNGTDHHIATCILKKIAKREELTLEKVSEETDVSQASVSRFIRRAGFSSWQDFRGKCEQGAEIISLKRKIISNETFNGKKNKPVQLCRYDDITDNLKKTKETLDIDKINEIVGILKSSSNITVIGDVQAMSLFSPFQADMIVNGVPSYLFLNGEVQSLNTTYIDAKSLVILATTDIDFIKEKEIDFIKDTMKRGGKVVVFTQSHNFLAEIDVKEESDNIVVYEYGIEKTFNDGYYSLFYLLQIISELVYI
ncbi:MAG: hypothetical protein K6B15_01935 [Parasporobacterium sp.]|nr:hypothetical protein [Parasporobacterium sp.]